MKRLILLLGIILIIGVPSSLVYFLPRELKIDSVTCSSQFGPCNKDLVEELEAFQGRSYKETKSGISDLLSTKTLISDYSTHFRLPNRIEVNVLMRKPRYGLTYGDDQAYALIDREGYVVSFNKETALPFIVSNEAPPNVGERVGGDKLFALGLIEYLFEFYKVRRGTIENDSLVVELGTGETVIFPLEGDRQVLAASLGIILNKLNTGQDESRIENVDAVGNVDCQPTCTIDLRYENPVIR